MFMTSVKNTTNKGLTNKLTSNKISSLYIFETLVGEVVAGFTPLDLFQNGEQGVWYDPSDLSTLFQDDAGTTPVTADGDPVGLMLDKSQGLVLGTEQTVNGGFDTDSDWTLNTNWSISGGRLVASGVTQFVAATQNTLTTGAFCKIVLDIPVFTAGVLRIIVGTNTVKTVASSGVYTYYGKINGNNTFILQGDSGTPLECEIESVSVQEALGNHATQSVSALRPTYRTDGTLHWLEFDGVDDNMYTSANFGLSLNSSVFASAAFVDADVNQNFTSIFSQNAGSPRNCFNLSIGDNATSGLSRIGTDVWQPAGLYGDTNITQSSPYVGTWMIDDWATHFTTGANLYLNGVVETLNVFNGANTPLSITNAPLYLGEFGGALSNSRLNGNFYGGVIIRDDIGTQDERVDIESYLAEKSGVTL